MVMGQMVVCEGVGMSVGIVGCIRRGFGGKVMIPVLHSHRAPAG